MNFFQKLLDSFKQAFSSFSQNLSQGFSNFSFAALFGIGSAQAAPPQQPPAGPPTVQQPQAQPGVTPQVAAPGVKPGPAPTGAPAATTPSAAEMRTAFEKTLTPEQQKLYTRHENSKDPFPSIDANGKPIMYGIAPFAMEEGYRQAREAREAFEKTLTPEQLRQFKAVEAQENKENDSRIGLDRGLTGRDRSAPITSTSRINPETGLIETVTPADPALGDRGVARVDLNVAPPLPAAAPVAEAPAAEPAAEPQRAMRAPRQRVYTEAGPDGSSTQVRPAQYEAQQRPYMGESGPNRGAGFPMRPFQQETAERAAFNPHNPNAVQNRVMDALSGNIMGRMGNSAFSPIVAGVLGAARYDMGRNVPPMQQQGYPDFRGHWGNASTHGGAYGNANPAVNPAADASRQAVMQGMIQDGVNTALTNLIPQHSNPGGAFGALLGKLGR